MKLKYKVGLIVVIAIILFGAMGAYIIGSFRNFLRSPAQNQTPEGRISLSSLISQSKILEYNNSQGFLSFSLVTYSVVNASNASATIDIYAKNPVERIYLVNVSSFCVSCFDENALQSELRSDLISYDLIKNGTSFNYVSMGNVTNIPANSTVILPSGLMPISLMNDSGAGLLRLLDRGDTIVYVGLNFSKAIGPDGLIFVNPPKTLVNFNASGIGTLPLVSTPQSANSMNISFVKPTFLFYTEERYGNVTYANSRNGTIIAFSNYPKSAWNSSASMASDIATAIDARFWILDLGHYAREINVTSKPSGAIGVFANTESLRNLTQLGVNINNTYSLIRVSARNRNGFAKFETEVRDRFSEMGSVSVPARVGETQNIPILIKVNSTNPNDLFHLQIQDSNMSFVSTIPVGFISNSFGVVKYYAFSLPSGYYSVSIADFNNRDYASSFFHLENASIVPVTLDFKNGTFSFSIFSNGFPVTNATFTANLNGGYVLSGSVVNGGLTYSLPRGTIIGYGNESFRFDMFNSNYTYSTQYIQKVFNIPSVYIEFAIAILVVVLLNLVLQPPNRDDYFIDVPEFPSSKKEQVKVQASDILNVFDKVNYYYHWKYMPLTSEEIRSGIGNNIRVKSMPISITTQNTNNIIFTLLDKGGIENASNYYAPSTWVEASGHSVEYLVIFRKLRDYCVSHAMLFTDLDSIDGADMFVTKNSKQISLFIYTTTSQMKKITLSNDSRVFVVFLNDEVMQGFFDKLYSSFGKDVEVLKLGIEYNYIKLIDSDHLDQLSF